MARRRAKDGSGITYSDAYLKWCVENDAIPYVSTFANTARYLKRIADIEREYESRSVICAISQRRRHGKERPALISDVSALRSTPPERAP